MQDNIASTTVVGLAIDPNAAVVNHGILSDSTNSSTISVAGPGGRLTRAFDFAGDPKNIYLDNPPFFATDAMTLEWWCKRDASNHVDPVCGTSGGEAIWFTDAGVLTVRDANLDTSTITLTGVTTTNWHHYALTRTAAGALSLYIDGRAFGNLSASLGEQIRPAAVAHDDETAYFEGLFADFRAYDVVRDKAQVANDAFYGGALASHYSKPLGSSLGVKLFSGQLGG